MNPETFPVVISVCIVGVMFYFMILYFVQMKERRIRYGRYLK